jgi:hypothetical protein
MGSHIRFLGWNPSVFGTPPLFPYPHFREPNLTGLPPGAGAGEPPGALREEETIHQNRTVLETHGIVRLTSRDQKSPKQDARSYGRDCIPPFARPNDPQR